MNKILLITLSLLSVMGCTTNEPQPIAGAPEHHTTMGFTNPHIDDPDKSFFSFLKMRYFGDTEWADHQSLASQVATRPVDIQAIATPGDAPLVTWLGHSTFLIQYKGMNILTDPIFSDRASPVSFSGPKRYVPHVIDYRLLNNIDAVVISHNHYDHLDQVAVEQLRHTSHFFVPLGIKSWLIEEGVSANKITEMDWWATSELASLSIQALPSQHWSARGLGDRFETLWASWSLQIDNFHLWFAGDTGYNSIQFKQIGEQLSDIDLALIPIGAYAPRSFMKTYHVNPEEAVQIHQDVGASQSIGMHWGTFPLTAEAPAEPPKRLEKALKQANLARQSFISMTIGQSVKISLQ